VTWTYRVRKKALSATEIAYGLVEVYNTTDGDGWTRNDMAPIAIMEPGDPTGDAKALDELRWQLERMLEALDKPILEDGDTAERAALGRGIADRRIAAWRAPQALGAARPCVFFMSGCPRHLARSWGLPPAILDGPTGSAREGR
jgi:hypothetical protein